MPTKSGMLYRWTSLQTGSSTISVVEVQGSKGSPVSTQGAERMAPEGAPEWEQSQVLRTI